MAWPIFSFLDADIRERIVIAQTYESGSRAIIQLDDGLVYRLTALPIAPYSETHELRGLDENDTIARIIISHNSKELVITETGKLYILRGLNFELPDWLPDGIVADACLLQPTYDDTPRLVLLVNNIVYLHTREILNAEHYNETITSIHAYYDFQQLLCGTESGRILRWYREQHIDTTARYEVPNDPVLQIVTGMRHAVFLGRSGRAFTIGSNEGGALGKGLDNTNFRSHVAISRVRDPSVWKHRMNGFVELYSHAQTSLTVARASDNSLFFWGQIRKHSVNAPIPAPGNSVSMIFSTIDQCPTSPLNIRRLTDKRLMPSHLRLCKILNDSTTADVQFHFSNETILYGHKFVLSNFSSYFATMLQQRWNDDRVDITHYSYDAYHALFEYIYTGYLRVPSSIDTTTTVNILLELLRLAHEIEADSMLVEISEYILARVLTSETALSIYETANVLEQSTLKRRAAQYANIHMTDILKSISYRSMDASRSAALLQSIIDSL